MKIGNLLKLVLILCVLHPGWLPAGEPQFSSIDYANPVEYLSWPDTLGDRNAILDQALALKGDSDLETLRTGTNPMMRGVPSA